MFNPDSSNALFNSFCVFNIESFSKSDKSFSDLFKSKDFITFNSFKSILFEYSATSSASLYAFKNLCFDNLIQF